MLLRSALLAVVAVNCLCSSSAARRRSSATLSANSVQRTLERELESEAEYSFEDYKRQYGKHYGSAVEHAMREKLFEQRRAEVVAHNLREKAGQHSHRLGINQFTDVTSEEMSRNHKGYAATVGGVAASLLQEEGDVGEGRRGCGAEDRLCPKGKPNGTPVLLEVDRFAAAREGLKDQEGNDYHVAKLEDLPKSVDWTKYMSSPKSQGGCGSCWAFATTAVMEGYAKKNTKKSFDLSEQMLVNCVDNIHECGGTGGCKGATSELGFDYIHKQGQMEEAKLGYTQKDGDCPAELNATEKRGSDAVVSLEGYSNIPSNSYLDLMTAVSKGPLTISVDAASWQSYSGGILQTEQIWKNEASTLDIDHAVSLVGYGEDKGLKYWKVRNSWGPLWGESGYIRVHRSDDDDKRCRQDVKPCDGIACKGECDTPVTVCGTSGILYCSSYPINVGLFDDSIDPTKTQGKTKTLSEADQKLQKRVTSKLTKLEAELAKSTALQPVTLTEALKNVGGDIICEILKMTTGNAHAQEIIMKVLQRVPAVAAKQTELTGMVMADMVGKKCEK